MPEPPECLPRVHVVGIGNPDRGDDGIGPWVAEQIATRGWPTVRASALRSDDGTLLFSTWAGAERVYIVDAVEAGLPPGTILRLTPSQLLRNATVRTLSTHGVGLREVVELGSALGVLPDRLAIYGIVGRTFAVGSGLSSEVATAGSRVVARLRRSINTMGKRHA